MGDCLLSSFFYYRRSPKIGTTFFLSIDYVFVLTKNGLGYDFLAYFFTNSSGHPASTYINTVRDTNFFQVHGGLKFALIKNFQIFRHILVEVGRASFFYALVWIGASYFVLGLFGA
jgi:hypothetical protein